MHPLVGATISGIGLLIFFSLLFRFSAGAAQVTRVGGGQARGIIRELEVR